MPIYLTARWCKHYDAEEFVYYLVQANTNVSENSKHCQVLGNNLHQDKLHMLACVKKLSVVKNNSHSDIHEMMNMLWLAES